MRMLGLENAKLAWSDAFDNRLARWPRDCIANPSLTLPSDGIGAKVVLDRARELLHMTSLLTETKFLEFYAPAPIVQKVGGCARALALLSNRAMLLGTDRLPVKFPPQQVFRIQRLLTPRPAKSTRRKLAQQGSYLPDHLDAPDPLSVKDMLEARSAYLKRIQPFAAKVAKGAGPRFDGGSRRRSICFFGWGQCLMGSSRQL